MHPAILFQNPPQQPELHHEGPLPGLIAAEASKMAWLPDPSQLPAHEEAKAQPEVNSDPMAGSLGATTGTGGTAAAVAGGTATSTGLASTAREGEEGAGSTPLSPSALKGQSTSDPSAGQAGKHTGGVVWQWEHKTGFRDYKAADNAKIETAFQRGDSKVRVKSGKAGTSPMEIFFTDMLQYDVKTGNARRVQRTGDDTKFTEVRRYIMEWIRSWETGQPRRQTYKKYKTRQQALTAVEEVFDVTSLYSETSWAGRVVRSSTFFVISMSLVFLNVVWIGVDVDKNDSGTITEADTEFQVMEYFFCICFTIELFIRFLAFKRKRDFIWDAWFCYDALLVLLMFVDTLLIPFLQLITGGDTASFLQNVSVLRLFRLLKLARMTRLLRVMPELMTMLRGIVAAFRSVIFTFILQLLLLYIFGIIFTTWTRTHSLESLDGYFGTLPLSIYSLLVHGTLMDEPSSPLNDMIAVETPTLVTLFLIFLILSSLTVLNMLVGILFQVVADVSEAEKLKNEQEYLRNSLMDIFDCYDGDGDRTVGKNEFGLLMENPEVHDVLAKFGTDVKDLVTLADLLFDDVTAESSKGTLGFEELLQVVLRLRGEHAARVTDIVTLREYFRQKFGELVGGLHHFQQEVIMAIGQKSDAVLSVAATVTVRLCQDEEERRQLRRSTTTVGEVLHQLASQRGKLLAVSHTGAEIGSELTLGELADSDGEVHLRLVQDSSPGLTLPSLPS